VNICKKCGVTGVEMYMTNPPHCVDLQACVDRRIHPPPPVMQPDQCPWGPADSAVAVAHGCRGMHPFAPKLCPFCTIADLKDQLERR